MSGEQVTIGGDVVTEETVFQATTDARAFVPWLRLFDFVDEYRIVVDESGLHVTVKEPATVMMVESTLHADAFESFDVSVDTQIGINASTLNSAVSFARYGKDKSDDIRLTYNDRDELTATVERDIEGVSVVGQETFETIEAATIREAPDMPEIEYVAQADMPASVFTRLVNQFDDFIKLSIDEAGVTLVDDRDEEFETGYQAGVETAGESTSLFSAGYLKDIASGVSGSVADSLTLRNTDDHPLEVQIEREGVFEATYLQAPRIRE